MARALVVLLGLAALGLWLWLDPLGPVVGALGDLAGGLGDVLPGVHWPHRILSWPRLIMLGLILLADVEAVPKQRADASKGS